MKFALNQLPDEIYFHFYELDRTPFGDPDEEESSNMLALVASDGTIIISHDDYLSHYFIERGEIGYDWFYEKMKGFEIKS